jgi:hypothetical protein
MDENFTQSALRHWRDAELLKAQNHVENADQLYGIAAECALKSALVSSPHFAVNGELQKGYKEHIDILWDKIQVQSLEKRFPGLPAVLSASNPFQDWNVDQRYAFDGNIKARTIETHQKFARRLLGAVQLLGTLGI